MQNWSARCIVCGRELSPGGDPLVCDTCPRPETDDRTLPPVEPPSPAVPLPHGTLPGMAARPGARAEHLAVWEGVGVGFAAAALGSLIWYELAAAVGSLIPFIAVGLGALIGAAFGFDVPYRARSMLSSLAGLVALTTIVITTYLIERRPLAAFGGVDLVLPADEAFDLVWTALEDQPVMLVWWVIGVVLAIRAPAVR